MRFLISLPALLLLLIAGCAQVPPSPVPAPTSSQSRAVVFDVDGTLTPDVLAITEVRANAAKAVGMYAEQGYKIVYLSVRIQGFQAELPAWLKENGFPDGSIHVSQASKPDEFKAGILNEYKAKGWILVGAYGDSETDFAAYAKADIPKNRVFALKRRGWLDCTEGVYRECLAGWTEHLTFISNPTD